jgi:5-methylcytosine-specific restriction enzyme subunit McrC
MGYSPMQRINLQEGEAKVVSLNELNFALAETIQRQWNRFIQIDLLLVQNAPGFALKSRGYVGRLVLPNVLEVNIAPKIPIYNLLGMLETAYALEAFQLLDGESQYPEIHQIFEVLAGLFGQKVQYLIRRGLYREYAIKEAELPYIKGRLIPPLIPKTLLQCQYAEFGADGMDNRIILWTLYLLRRYPFGHNAVRQALRGAFLAMDKEIQLVSLTAEVFVGLNYHRLNQSYRPIHALCRFFLEHCGPLLGQGKATFSPFLLFMPRLFERFVGAWLKRHLKTGYLLKEQFHTPLVGSGDLAFQMDMVLQDKVSGKVVAVLDTKYKASQVPDTEDIQQVVAYAVRLDTRVAYLVYPFKLSAPVEVQIGSITVKAIGLDLSGALEHAGKDLLNEIDGILSFNTHTV